MAGVELRHFDYLSKHDVELEDALGLTKLSANVNRWRRNGMDDPDAALVGCRKTVELALRSLAKPLPNSRMDLKDVIRYARDEGIIDRTIAYQCDEIRRKGNLGAHALTVRPIEAKMALELLDDFLRWNAQELGLIPPHMPDDVPPKDPIFIVRSSEDVEELSRKAKLAAALDDDADVEKKARDVKGEITSFEESTMSDLQRMEALMRQAQEIGVSAAANNDKPALEAQKALFSGFEGKIEELSQRGHAVSQQFEQASEEVQRILNEHDFIGRLLTGDKWATPEQHDVMMFPKGSHTSTNILQVAGSAGTGKTLCLLAKLISEIDEHGQGSLFAGSEKTALFVCFNKALANYVRGILDNYEGERPKIDVESYDLFVNQLVRKHPRSGYEHLKSYATDAKYQSATIMYSSNDEYVGLLKAAQQTVAKRYPRYAREYYLNPAKEDDLSWLSDEIMWIEGRYVSVEDANRRYLNDLRAGRGTKRRPSPAIRKIILEVWQEFNRLLEESGHYTIDHATKRLLDAEKLPKYDAIAIDEVQDFSLLSIRLLLKLRRGDTSKVFISGDENQKIYKRDFTWKQLDEGLKGYTITLHKNMRNSDAIRRFSDRLIGAKCPHSAAEDKVYVVDADEGRTVQLLCRLADPSRPMTTALITDQRGIWEKMLQSANVPIAKKAPGDIVKPGIYILGARMGKGLEFDNEVVDYVGQLGEDEEEEKRLRYVHFTRARYRLYIRYQGTPPSLLEKYYGDFL